MSDSYEAFRDACWDRERKTDADLRAGIIDGMRLRYRYVGPPLVLTPERWIERAWLQGIECRTRARFDVWMMAVEAKDRAERQLSPELLGLLTNGSPLLAPETLRALVGEEGR